MARRVLVAGGAGFLGTHLCNRLRTDGLDVLSVDIENDITTPIDADVHDIYNLACHASPIKYQSDPIHTLRTNVIGSMNLLELATRRGAKIMQASTSEIYGDPTVHPQNEDYRGNVSPIGTRACYDEGKRCAETLFFDYHRRHGTRIKVARIFNTYGPGMRADDGRVVSNFIVQALQNDDITLYGDGNQTRSFCYVDDLIDGFVRLMATKDFTGPVNLGNPHEITVRELALRIIAITESKSRIVYHPLPQDDPTRRCPDISLARNALGWEPRVGLDEGLTRTIEYFHESITR